MGINLKDILFSIPGWTTRRKIVVFESDDWGSIRITSRKNYDRLLKHDLLSMNSAYDNYDCLENRQDLESLFNTLSLIKDINGNHPVFTFNFVMGNPDFDTIRQNSFEKYFFEHFLTSYNKYYGDIPDELLNKGFSEKFFVPQFHAREHLNSQLWIKDLKNGISRTRKAFDYEFFGLKTDTSSQFQNHYLAAYQAENSMELNRVSEIVNEGLEMFSSTFQFDSKSFTACNYVWPKELEKYLSSKGVLFFQGQRAQLIPDFSNKGKIRVQRHYMGQQNNLGQYYLIRNVLFEPSSNKSFDWVSSALNQINWAFRFRKPAIISSHRMNFVGSLDCKQRDRNLNDLIILLRLLKKNWPEIEFMSSLELFDVIKN